MMTKKIGHVVSVAMAAALMLSAPISTRAGSLNDWVDACAVVDDDLLQLLENEAMLVDESYLIWDGTHSTASLPTVAYTISHWMYGFALCPDAPFFGQPEVDGAPFRSAVQVGPDLVLTAWHSSFPGAPSDPTDYVAIFGLRYRNSGASCVAPDFGHIPAAQIYTVTGVVADGMSHNPPADFLLLALDRSATATYPRVRRSGRGQAGNRLTLIAHQERLATKVDLHGQLTDYAVSMHTGPRVENLHTAQGSSGGMVYNRDEKFLETVVRDGEGIHWELDSLSECRHVINVEEPFETNDSLADFFSESIPAFELLVSPLDTILHTCLSGACIPANSTKVVEAPMTATSGIHYLVSQPTGTAPQLVLSIDNDEGTLQPGDSFQIGEAIDATGAVCGQTYERTYTVTDTTHGFSDVVRHQIRVRCP